MYPVKPSLEDVLDKAAQLQELVPGAVLVGGTAVAVHTGHRESADNDLDIAALADYVGLDQAATVLERIDEYYADLNRRPEAVATQLARQLADPRPRDPEVTTQLAGYKALDRTSRV